VLAQAQQLGQQMRAEAGLAAALGAERPGLGEQLLEGLAQAREFFLALSGEGGTSRRFRISTCLLSMIQSQTSPFWNCIAWAMGAGKLMYHCWEFLRSMS
jgi:hypothetical protein